MTRQFCTKRPAKKGERLLALLSLLTILLGACGPAVTPTPQQTSTPKATPQPLPAPRLLSHTPAVAEEQRLDAPVELAFDQPMDHGSVEAAFAITPTIQGQFTWKDARTVAFAPAGGFQRGTRYRVTVAATARSAEGKPLPEATTFDFSAVGFLSVSQVQPTPDSDELAPDMAVTVVFNRPVVPLTAIGSQGELPQPLTFMPPVDGQGEWLNTSIYIFRPRGGFLPATQYIARVAAGLNDTTGAVLEDDYTWTFTTLHPAVLDLSPYDGFQYVGPSDAISITFNQPMDHASVQSSFSLRAGGRPVAGTFRWSGGKTPTAPETMAFVPSQPLPRSSAFQARLAAGALAKTGSMGIPEGTSWAFTTVNEPGVVGTYPEDGQQDVPLYESVRIVFASPMDTEVFTRYVTIASVPLTSTYFYWSEYETVVEISFPKKPATLYTVVLDGAAPDKYGALLGRPTRIRFTTGDLSPFASLNTGGSLATISAYTDTTVYARYVNVSQLDLGLYRMSLADFMRLNGFGDWNDWENYRPSGRDLVRRWSPQVRPPRNQERSYRFDLVEENGEQLAPGLYYVEMTAPEILKLYPNSEPARFMFVRSRVNLVMKQEASAAMIWATDLASGQPVAGLPVAFHAKSGLIPGGSTDADGLLQKDVAVPNLWDPLFAVAGQPGEDGFAVAYNGWVDGIAAWDFNVDSEFYPSDYVGYLYTDRPIYRPGQTVYFKGIARADDDAHYSVPQELGGVQVRISDPQGKKLYEENLTLSDMGTLYSELALDQEAPLGTYSIDMSAPKANFYASTSFNVAEYRVPEYQVSVTTGRPAYLAGDTIDVTAEATYYFGGPVTGAAVHWSVLSEDYWFSYQCPAGADCPWYDWSDNEWSGYWWPGEGTSGRLVAEGDAKTDDQGRVTFRVPADISTNKVGQRFTIEASVTDINGQQVSNRTAAVVHKGEFYIGLAPQGYVSPAGQEKKVDIITVDWDSQSVAGVPLTVVFMEEHWYSVQKQDESGSYYWDWIARDTPVLTQTVTTGADGKAVASFTPAKSGSYRVRAIGRDTHENEIRSSTYFWIWGGGYVSWRQESNNRITLIADKKEYQVGDTAEILIPSPYSGTVHALVTIERGHIMQREVRELQGNSEVLRVPIEEDFVPNVFVSVVIVQGSDQDPAGMPTFKMGLINLPVSVADKELKITLTPDKDMGQGQHYGPRQTATYDVLVTDRAGNPVAAELSLRLADLAVLALADEPGATLTQTFWRSRGLGVQTSTPLIVSLEKYNREQQPGRKGGGGGGEEAEGGLVRTRFADTAFWEPAVRTGQDGKAQVQVELPDNLTTWRMQARGITADTRVGLADVDVLSTLDLLLRPVLPRFFVVGDKAEIATIVHNNTGQALDVQVEITLEGLALTGNASQAVQVPAGDKASVAWPVTVQSVDQVKVRMSARSGDLSDAREDTLPVYRYSTPEVVATAGRLAEAGQREEVVQLPQVLDPSQGELTVQIDGSLTAATQDGLKYLEHYPYECVEQTVSRFLPNVLTYQALKEMGLAKPDLEQKLAQMVGIGLQRLYARQHYDGGWGWWYTDKSDVYLTTYVLQGLLEAYRAGFVVDEDVMSRGAAFLQANLPVVSNLKYHWQANRLAYALYVLAEYNATFKADLGNLLGVAIRLFDQRAMLNRYGQAMLAVALGLLEPQVPDRVKTLLGDLKGDAIVSATGAHWEEATVDYWNMNTDIRSTAIVLWVMSRLDPQNELLPNTVRWLMTMRKEGHWATTQDTAWSLLALVAYMRASGEMEGDFSYAVYLNGTTLGSGDISRENLDQTQRLQVEIAKLLRDEANRLVIERQSPTSGQTGKGQLYYAAYLRYFLPADQVKALDRGISVARQYSPAEKPASYVTSAKVGDVIRVKLTIVAPNDLYYVVVEDPLPAGCEGVDLSLKTTSIVGEAPDLRNLTAEEQDVWYRWYGWGWWWFSYTEMRDEKVVLFATYLPRGTYQYTYLMRASVPGEFLTIPTNAYQMYFPEVFGRSDGAKFTVTGE